MGDVQLDSGRRTGCLWKIHSERRFNLFLFHSLYIFHLCTRVGGCGNVYPYTVTDDRVGRDKNRKDNGKEFSRRDCSCIRKFS